jgi:hypothetical protein
MTVERSIINALEQRLTAEGYNVQFGRVIDPDNIEDERLPVLSMQLGAGGISPDVHRPKLRSTMDIDLLLWVELKSDDGPVVEMIQRLGELKRAVYQPGDDGIDSILGRDGYVNIEAGTIDIEMQQTGYGLALLSLQVHYIG